VTSVRPATSPPPVTGATRVRLHPLSMRPDGESWVIGRVETGDFISVPPVAHRAITLLSEGRTVEEVRSALLADGDDVDVADFVTALADLRFLSHLDGHPLNHPVPPRPTFPWLRPEHVRWLLHPAAALTTAALILSGAALMVIDPALVPGYHDLIWSGSGGAVILGNAAIAWVIVFLHELGHLATARAAGIPGRMSLSTRLYFLVTQTDVSGVWAHPRRTRLTVILAGMAVNLVISAVCVLILAVAAPTGLTHGLLAATALISLVCIPWEFLVFMRSDVYFVLQDVTGCANLYADGSAHFRYRIRRLWYALRRSGGPLADPGAGLPTRQRHAVRAYTLILVAGTAICLTVALTTSLPVAVILLTDAVGTILGDASAAARFDAIAVITVFGSVQALWARAWWRRHGHRVRRLYARRPEHPRKEVPDAENRNP